MKKNTIGLLLVMLLTVTVYMKDGTILNGYKAKGHLDGTTTIYEYTPFTQSGKECKVLCYKSRDTIFTKEILRIEEKMQPQVSCFI